MAESKMKEVAKLLGVEMDEPFNIKNFRGNRRAYCPYTLKDNGVYDRDGDLHESALTYLLNGDYEIEKSILTEKEKRYLERVLRPFKDKVRYISKESVTTETHFIKVNIPNDSDMPFPNFEKGAMYKGMEIDRKYALEELGLFEND